MYILTVSQPWATLLARGAARFAVRHDATDYRGTVAIRASALIDNEVVTRLAAEPEFAERLAALGLGSIDDLNALPREAFVGLAAIADLWSFGGLEEVATEDDAILLGDVGEYAVFWELAEAVEIAPIDATEVPSSDGATAEQTQDDRPDDADAGEKDATAGDDGDEIEEDDEADGDEVDEEQDQPLDPPFDTAPDELATRLRAAAQAAGARFDEGGVVFWPVFPSDALAILIGRDAVGDREITRRVWAHVVEHDLQDPEDHAWVYLDDALRSALDTNEDGMTTVEFTAKVVAQMLHSPTA